MGWPGWYDWLAAVLVVKCHLIPIGGNFFPLSFSLSFLLGF